jgi:hypothetical protein
VCTGLAWGLGYLPALPPEPTHGSLTAAMAAVAVKRRKDLSCIVTGYRNRLVVVVLETGLDWPCGGPTLLYP